MFLFAWSNHVRVSVDLDLPSSDENNRVLSLCSEVLCCAQGHFESEAVASRSLLGAFVHTKIPASLREDLEAVSFDLFVYFFFPWPAYDRHRRFRKCRFQKLRSLYKHCMTKKRIAVKAGERTCTYSLEVLHWVRVAHTQMSTSDGH